MKCRGSSETRSQSFTPIGAIFGRFRTVDVGGARIISGAEKKSFDRGGPVWPPRSNVTNDRLGGGFGGVSPPQPKTGGSGGQRRQAEIEYFF